MRSVKKRALKAMKKRTTPSYRGLCPASAYASAAARGTSRKRDTRCERMLRRALWAAGIRYRIDDASLPGRPDIVLRGARIVIFCDGDFWHGRHLKRRLSQLRRGHNSRYWMAKIRRNVERDRVYSKELVALGWTVVRYWETDILKDCDRIAADIRRHAMGRASTMAPEKALPLP